MKKNKIYHIFEDAACSTNEIIAFHIKYNFLLPVNKLKQKGFI